MPKNAYILEKSWKITAVSGVHPQTHVGLRRMETTPQDPRIITPTYWYRFDEVRFLPLYVFYYFEN